MASKKATGTFAAYQETPRARRYLYWLTPIIALAALLGVMATVIVWLDQLEDPYLILTADTHRTLVWVVASLCVVIIWSLIALWRHTLLRQRAEAALIAETAFRRAMENSMLTGMRVLDMEGRITYVNPAFCRIIGWNESDLIGRKPPFPYWVPGQYAAHQRMMDMLLAGNAPTSGLEMQAQRRDGSRLTTRMYVSPLVDRNGVQTGWMTSLTDITESKRIRETLAAAHERFMTVLEGLDDAISVTADGPQGLELLFTNKTYRRIFGSQATGHAQLLAGRRGRYTDEAVEVYSPMAKRWFEVHHRMLAWTDGRRVRLQVARDITERRAQEEASLRQQEKIQMTSRLITMGEMASSLAHELNQPLTAIANYSMGVVARVRAGEVDPRVLLPALEKTAAQAERAGLIIRRIREFVKRSEPRRQPVDLSSVINNAVGFADIDAQKRRIDIIKRLPAALPKVMADPILIEQVLLNLIKNGMEAMENLPGHEVVVSVAPRDDVLEVSVADQGHGLGDIDPARLFEPFFSTKGEGMGMGLNICRTIIESHHGRLWAVPNPGGGTIFSFTLPIVPGTLVEVGTDDGGAADQHDANPAPALLTGSDACDEVSVADAHADMSSSGPDLSDQEQESEAGNVPALAFTQKEHLA